MADIIFARFTDGSSGRLPDGDIMKYGVGGFFGWQNPLNFALPASPSCASMYECELEAVYQAFLSSKRLAETQGGIPLGRRIMICIDNVEAKSVLDAALLEVGGSLCLESLLCNNSRVRHMIHEIRNMSKGYISVELKWVRSHTGSRSFLARGNDEADSLAKEGLQKAFERIEDIV